MSESSEESATNQTGMTGMRRLGIAYSFKFGTGILLIILGAIASGQHSKIHQEFPYSIGAFLVGIAMALFGVINFRNWQNIRRGNATLNQKAVCVRIEAVISIISIIFGFIGLIIVGVNGIKAPLCVSLFGSCSNYKNTSSYKLAVAILVFLIVSIIINIVYFVILRLTFKRDGVDIFKGRSNQYPHNRHRQQPLPGATYQTTNAPIVLNTYHGQPEAYSGAIIHTGVSNVPTQPVHSTGMQDAPIVLNTYHGQPEAYGGAIIHPGVLNVPNQSGHVTCSQDQGPIVLNYRHGQPEPFAGAIISHPGVTGNVPAHSSNGQQHSASTGYILSSHHGQPQPFEGAVMSTPTQHSMSEGNHSLVSELQEQNRLLQEQLALQQQQLVQQEHTDEPSAPVDESPPSYEECMTDPSKIKYLEEQNRKLKSRFQDRKNELVGNSSAQPDNGYHPSPSAPPM